MTKTQIVVELAFKRISSLGGQCQTQGGSLSMFDEQMSGGSVSNRRLSVLKGPMFQRTLLSMCVAGAMLGLGVQGQVRHTPTLRDLTERQSHETLSTVQGRGGPGGCAENNGRGATQTSFCS